MLGHDAGFATSRPRAVVSQHGGLFEKVPAIDELGHARSPAHWLVLPAKITPDGDVTVDARLLQPGRTEIEHGLAGLLAEGPDTQRLYDQASIGDLIHASATGALTQYIRAVIVATRAGRYALPLALLGHWQRGSHTLAYYAHMIEQRRLQRFPAEHVWESDAFQGCGRMVDPAGLPVSRNSPPSPLLDV